MKKTILAVVVASAFAMPAHADIKNVDIYGQIAVSAWSGANWAESDGKGGWDNPVKVENESRIGLRGSKDFAHGPKFIWQIESGDVGDSGETGKFGVRDTFGGFEWDGIGKVRFGRMLTPLYELVDWPYSAITVGQVYDWAGDVIGGGNYDRQSNMVRFDSASFNGFSYNLALGRGNEKDADSNFYGAGLHFKTGPVTLHAAYEKGDARKVSTSSQGAHNYLNNLWGQSFTTVDIMTDGTSDTDAYLLGFELAFENGLGFYGSYKRLEADYSNVTIGDKTSSVGLYDITQDSYSLGAIYNVGLWQFKLAYAANLDPDIKAEGFNGKGDNFSDSILSAQALYFLDDSAVTYIRPYQLQRRGAYKVQDGDKEFGLGVGVEYYF